MTVDETSEMPTHQGGGTVNLDVLRGWSDAPDPALRGDHALPSLARLVATDGGKTHAVIPLHGPDVYIGRFHPQAGPVDIVPVDLADHEVYKFAAPHVRISYQDGDWVIVPTAPNGVVRHNGERLTDVGIRALVKPGDDITLGVVTFQFEVGPATFDEWFEQHKTMLSEPVGPTLFLKRFGAIAGPSFSLNRERSTVIGRRFPEPATVGAGWPQHPQPDWNMSGLYDHEAKFVGFRHAELACKGDEWTIKPISLRQRTYLNRVEIVSETPLLPGDEVGLGSILFHFHHPADLEASTDHRTAELPTVVDWQREHTSPELDPVSPVESTVAEDDDDDLFGGGDD